MSKLFYILLMAAVLCSALSVAFSVDVKDNITPVEEHDDEEISKYNSKAKCYDEDVKSEFKVDSLWYPRDKCEQRICSRQRNLKTPIIKIMKCIPCTTCNSPDEICHPFRPDKTYPYCCPRCLTKSAILKKKERKLINY